MKFGVAFMGVRMRDYAPMASILEAHGFESLWMPEHLVLPAEMPPTYPYSESGFPPISPDTPCFDPWPVLSYLSCATESIRLATNVFVLPLRHPLITARSVVTLDRLSGGRVTLGIGVGWLEPEFRWVDVPFDARGRITDETIDVLRRLWSEDVIDHRGEHFEFGPLKFAPKPIQQPIPIEVGGTSPAALRRAGRLGDGWIEHGTTSFDELSDRIGRIQTERLAAGRSSEPFEITVSGRLASDLDDMRRARDLGATRILLSPFVQGPPSIQDIEDWAARFVDEIMTAIDD